MKVMMIGDAAWIPGIRRALEEAGIRRLEISGEITVRGGLRALGLIRFISGVDQTDDPSVIHADTVLVHQELGGWTSECIELMCALERQGTRVVRMSSSCGSGLVDMARCMDSEFVRGLLEHTECAT